MRLPGSDIRIFTPTMHRYVRLAIKGALCSEKSLPREPMPGVSASRARTSGRLVHHGELAPHGPAEFALSYDPPLREYLHLQQRPP